MVVSGAIGVHLRSSAVEIFLLPAGPPRKIEPPINADERRWVRAVRVVRAVYDGATDSTVAVAGGFFLPIVHICTIFGL
jgi:hypothetical protein